MARSAGPNALLLGVPRARSQTRDGFSRAPVSRSRLRPGSWIRRERRGEVCVVHGLGETHPVGEGELWLGNPARRVRRLTAEEIERLDYSAQHYVRLKNRYLGVGS